jgi:hypothetical protein
MSDLNINNITDRTGGSGPVIAGVSTVTSTGAFTVPVGPTEMRGGRGRGVFGGGSPSYVNILNFITIATTGNAEDFGDMTTGHQSRASFASATRGIWAGGYTPSGDSSKIDYVIISSKGGASDFGDAVISRQNCTGTSDSTRGIYGGSRYAAAAVNNSNLIEFITIATTGNGSTFGELTVGRGAMGTCSSPTRGIFAGGGTSGTVVAYKTIEYVTIQTLGNAQDFGELTGGALDAYGGASSTTRGLISGIYPAVPATNTIDYITIATLGNAADFGDLTQARGGSAKMSNSVRGVFAKGRGGSSPYTYYNIIDYVTIASTGNAADFGDATSTEWSASGCSDSHGGLG